jgi:integrase
MSRLIDQTGQRKYLNEPEAKAFLNALNAAPPDVAAFCLTLYHTDCRVSEALGLTAGRVDFHDKALTFQTLKRKGGGVAYRTIPVPDALLDRLHPLVNGLEKEARLWRWHRKTAWVRVKEIMKAAGLEGTATSPRGLRHTFGVRTQRRNVPLPLLKKWLGHSKIENTIIYADILGDDEREMAKRLWD